MTLLRRVPGSRTNLELVLAEPRTLSTSKGEVTASRVGLWVDEPRETAARIRPRLGTQAGARSG